MVKFSFVLAKLRLCDKRDINKKYFTFVFIGNIIITFICFHPFVRYEKESQLIRKKIRHWSNEVLDLFQYLLF